MHGRSAHGPTIEPAVPSPERPAAPGTRTTSPGALGPTTATLPHGVAGGAVVLFGTTEAVIARTRADGLDEIRRLKRRIRRSDAPPFFVRVIHELDDRSPVVILGPAAERTAFEREFVRIVHRPDRILEDAAAHDAHPQALLERLRLLRSHPG